MKMIFKFFAMSFFIVGLAFPSFAEEEELFEAIRLWIFEGSQPALDLIEAGVNVNARYEGTADSPTSWYEQTNEYDAEAYKGQTLLMYAAGTFRWREIVVALIEAGADLDLRDGTTDLNLTALILAANNGYLDMVNLLISKGAHLDDDILLWTVESGQTDAIQALIDAGANVNATLRGDTAFHWAAGYGYASVVDILLKAGADVNAVSDNGRTPLFWASINGYNNIVQTLVDAGADVSIKDKNGKTALDLAYAGWWEDEADHLRKSHGENSIEKLLMRAGAR